MKETSSRQFGLIVAYLLPGFIALAGMAPLFPAVAAWLRPVNQGEAGFGPAVYALLAAMTVGMIVSCVRWLVVDHVHHWMGVVPPVWEDAELDENLAAFNYIVEAHYRYYQFYGNTLVAIACAYALNRLLGALPLLNAWTDLTVIIVCVVLFAGSRDTLRKYYNRTRRLLGVVQEKGSRGALMTNGNHVSEQAGASSQAPRLTQVKDERESTSKARSDGRTDKQAKKHKS